MDYPHQNPTPISGSVIAAIVFFGFLALLLVGLGITTVVHDPNRASTATPSATVPAPAATPAPTPATELPAVKEPNVPTRSQQPNDTVDTAPATPPPSEPGSPSPNVPTPAP